MKRSFFLMMGEVGGLLHYDRETLEFTWHFWNDRYIPAEL
jgi:hypothetical protein